ncbi:hypothetical protein D3C71_1376000 [compost metagenome]
MLCNKILAFAVFQSFGIFLVKGFQFRHIGIGIGLELLFVLRSRFGQPLLNIPNLLDRQRRRQPYMRVQTSMVMIMSALFMLSFIMSVFTVFMSLFAMFRLFFRAFHNLDSMTGLDALKPGSCGAIHHLIHPALHARAVIDKYVCLADGSHVLGSRLPIMRLHSGRNEIFHMGEISCNMTRELIHRIKARLDLQRFLYRCSGGRSRRCRFAVICRSIISRRIISRRIISRTGIRAAARRNQHHRQGQNS